MGHHVVPLRVVEVMQMASKALAVKTPDGGYAAHHGSGASTAGSRQIALMTLRAAAARDMSSRISSCAASLGLGPTLVALALGDDPTLPPSQLRGENVGEATTAEGGAGAGRPAAADSPTARRNGGGGGKGGGGVSLLGGGGAGAALTNAVADAMAFGSPGGASGLRRPGQLPKLGGEAPKREEKEEPKFGLDNDLARQVVAKLEKENGRSSRLAEKARRRHGRSSAGDAAGEGASLAAVVAAAKTAAAAGPGGNGNVRTPTAAAAATVAAASPGMAPGGANTSVATSPTPEAGPGAGTPERHRKASSIPGAGNSDPPVAMPERYAAADLFLALGGRSREHVDAMGGGGGRQERMLVSIVATRDGDLEVGGCTS
jgi:hypothetical protein